MFSLTTTGSWDNFKKFADKMTNQNIVVSNLDRYGKMGVDALSKATPIESGETARSWGYRIIGDKNTPGIEWYNTHIDKGVNVAIIIQYGHGTGTGGYVAGRDYINPAIKPVFDQIIAEIWKQVNS